MPFWFYSNGEFIQAGISCGCPGLCALIKNVQTLLLMAGAVSQRGLQSPSISGPFPFHLSCSCTCCRDHPLLPRVSISIPSQSTGGCPGWAGALTLRLSSLMPSERPRRDFPRSSAKISGCLCAFITLLCAHPGGCWCIEEGLAGAGLWLTPRQRAAGLWDPGRKEVKLQPQLR